VPLQHSEATTQATLQTTDIRKGGLGVTRSSGKVGRSAKKIKDKKPKKAGNSRSGGKKNKPTKSAHKKQETKKSRARVGKDAAEELIEADESSSEAEEVQMTRSSGKRDRHRSRRAIKKSKESGERERRTTRDRSLDKARARSYELATGDFSSSKKTSSRKRRRSRSSSSDSSSASQSSFV
jgi:hypothetical protein